MKSASSKNCADRVEVVQYANHKIIGFKFTNVSERPIDLDYDQFEIDGSYFYQNVTNNSLEHSVTCPGSLGQVECWYITYKFQNNFLHVFTEFLRKSQPNQVCSYRKI